MVKASLRQHLRLRGDLTKPEKLSTGCESVAFMSKCIHETKGVFNEVENGIQLCSDTSCDYWIFREENIAQHSIREDELICP